MLGVRYPLSLRNVEDLLHEPGVGIRHETVRFWWNRFGRVFAQRTKCRRLTLPQTFFQRERDSGLTFIRSPTLDRPKAEFSGFAQGDGLVTPPHCFSMTGTLMPIAPCGRCSL